MQEGTGGPLEHAGSERVALRSTRWFGERGLRTLGHRSKLKQMGLAEADFEGKPVIAVVNTWSGIASCHTHFRQRAEEVQRGVWQAGGFPLEIPAISLAEQFQKPTTMLYRNLLAMETEELLRSYPIDGAVLMGGCDKTTPGLLMGALSVGLPCIFLPGGPMLRGDWNGRVVGSGTSVFHSWAERQAETLEECELLSLEEGIARSPGHCMTMGTASTMTAAAEALGFTLPGASSIPAVDARHARMATETGRRAVAITLESLTPDRILTPASLHNAITTVLALGGSTNAVIHLLAVAGRAGIPLELDDFDRISRSVPVLANLSPSGEYLMEDFFYAGGLRALLDRLRPLLHADAATVNGRTIGENLEGIIVFNEDVIRSLDDPFAADGSLAILRGNLAPDGCVIKRSACEARLLRHRGPAVVFDSHEELDRRIDDDALDVTKDSVLVLRNAGPVGGPGMPEWGMLPLPRKLLRQGVRDMVRVSDARMSGTGFGTCVLHVAPESAIGGPLALVRDGDQIEVDVDARRLELLIDERELARRRAAWVPRPPDYGRGYRQLYQDSVTQANRGCDLTFLEGRSPDHAPVIH